MNIVIALLIGVLFGAGVFSLLRRSLVRLAVGLILISQAANLLVFVAGGLTIGVPAFIPEGSRDPAAVYADPLPQALVLTAIVIGFGLVAFLLALLWRAYKTVGEDDINAYIQSDL